jgi:hypothetical protein
MEERFGIERVRVVVDHMAKLSPLQPDRVTTIAGALYSGLLSGHNRGTMQIPSGFLQPS